MSEPYPDSPSPQPGFMQQRFMGIPAVVWLAGAAVVAYFLFFRGGGSGGGGGGTSSAGQNENPSTGDITVQPGTETIDLSGTTAATGTGVTDTAPVSGGQSTAVGTGGSTATSNPQPAPAPPPKKKVTTTKVKTPATTTVTVKKWPGKSSGGLAEWDTTLWGIANHYHTTVAALMKLNPSIKNANLIYPGQKVKVPTGK